MAANHKPTVVCVPRDKNEGKYDISAKRFHHTIDLFSDEPFKLEEIVLQQPGAYEGCKTYVAVRGTYFAFLQLPLELRQTIYRFVFGKTKPVYITNHLRSRIAHSKEHEHSRQTSCLSAETIARILPNKWAHALLLTSRTINIEATEFLYSSNRFVFENMSGLTKWLDDIGSSTKFLTHLEIEKSSVQVHRASAIYQQIAEAKNIKILGITLPTTNSGPINEHIDKHYPILKSFLVAGGANEAKALARLDAVHFRVCTYHKGVLSSDGTVLRKIDAAHNALCRARIRGYLQEHFAK